LQHINDLSEYALQDFVTQKMNNEVFPSDLVVDLKLLESDNSIKISPTNIGIGIRILVSNGIRLLTMENDTTEFLVGRTGVLYINNVTVLN
jgi:hypothetical protein